MLIPRVARLATSRYATCSSIGRVNSTTDRSRPIRRYAMETDVRARNNVRVFGRGAQPMLFAHGFGCDQNMWRWMTPAFENDYKIVLFDYVGSGKSDVNAYDRDRYATLDGYAQDIVDIVRELDLRDVILVAHSVSSMISVLAAIAEPDRFSRLIHHRPFAELPERRRRVPRRLRARGHRGTPGPDGQELHRMGQLPHADDHEERRAARTHPRAQRELLLDRSGDRPAVRGGHLPLRQSLGPASPHRSDPRPPVHG